MPLGTVMRSLPRGAEVVQLEVDLKHSKPGLPITVCQSLKFLVTRICDLPDVINCQFREFAFRTRAFSVAGPTVWNSLPDHLHDPAVDSKQFRRDLRRICSPDI